MLSGGNVQEWCQDWYNATYYNSTPSTNPTGPTSGTERVYRGGNWKYFIKSCRVSSRNSNDPSYADHDLGLRLALSAFTITFCLKI